MGRMELRRAEMSEASRLHMAPNTLSSSSRRDTRCSCMETPNNEPTRLQPRPNWIKTGHTPRSAHFVIVSTCANQILTDSAVKHCHRILAHVLPSDNMKPETSHSHSHWSCTSSCTPQGLHQSEGKIKLFLAAMIEHTVTIQLHNLVDNRRHDLSFGQDKLPPKNIWQSGDAPHWIFNRTVETVKMAELTDPIKRVWCLWYDSDCYLFIGFIINRQSKIWGQKNRKAVGWS